MKHEKPGLGASDDPADVLARVAGCVPGDIDLFRAKVRAMFTDDEFAVHDLEISNWARVWVPTDCDWAKTFSKPEERA